MSKWIALNSPDDLARIPQLFNTNPHVLASDRYEIIPTMDVVNAAQKLGWVPRWGAGVGDNPFGLHAIKMEHPDYVTVDGDLIQLVMINSHDRTRKFRIDVGAFRTYCSNGLIIPIVELLTLTQRHIGFDPEELMGTLDVAIESASQVGGVIKKMEQTIMTDEERYIFAEESLLLRLTEEQLDSIDLDQFLYPKRMPDHGNSLWKTYNVVQEKVIKGEFNYEITNNKGQLVNRKARSIDGFKTDLEINRSLFSLASEYI